MNLYRNSYLRCLSISSATCVSKIRRCAAMYIRCANEQKSFSAGRGRGYITIYYCLSRTEMRASKNMHYKCVYSVVAWACARVCVTYRFLFSISFEWWWLVECGRGHVDYICVCLLFIHRFVMSGLAVNDWVEDAIDLLYRVCESSLFSLLVDSVATANCTHINCSPQSCFHSSWFKSNWKTFVVANDFCSHRIFWTHFYSYIFWSQSNTLCYWVSCEQVGSNLSAFAKISWNN